MNKFQVTEGISGVWHYHISRGDKHWDSLCGKRTMQTNLSLKQWGTVSPHIGESYCKKCKELMDKETE